MTSRTVRRYLKWISFTIGVFLITGGFTVGYYWFYKLAPTIHLASAVWQRDHSPIGRWKEEQEDYRRRGSSPDMFFRSDKIGFYGNKDWTIWLVDNIINTKGFRVCGCTQSTFELMTNQSPDDSDKSWKEWLEKHKDETQEQWLQQGFEKYGVTVHIPPVSKDHKSLLMLLGNEEKTAEDEYIIPSEVKYNAFRWLRDSGFDWGRYIKERKDWQGSKQLSDGVCRFIRLETDYPIHDGLGILAFGEKPDMSTALEYDRRVPILSWWFKAIVYAIISTCFIMGATLVAISRRKRAKNKDHD